MHTNSQPHLFVFPLAQLAAAFALGVLMGHGFILPLGVVTQAALVCTSLAIAAHFRRKPRLATVLVTSTFLLLGTTLATLEKQDVASGGVKHLLDSGEVQVAQPVEVTGVLQREPERAHERRYLNLRVERVRARGFEKEASGTIALLVVVPEKSIEQEFNQLELSYGARIRVMTALDRMDKFRNPGVSSFTEYLDRKGYDATGFVKSPLLIERLENESVFLPLAWVYKWRSRLQIEIDSRFSNETAGDRKSVV